MWNGHYLTFKHRIVGFSAEQKDLPKLKEVEDWLEKEKSVLRAFVAGVSSSLFVQRATAILGADILALPYPDSRNLELSDNERIIASDIVEHQRDFVRKGTESRLMTRVNNEQLSAFDQTLARQISSIYPRNPLNTVQSYDWPGAVCRAYAFGDGTVDWSNADELQEKLDDLLKERKGTSLTITRIARIYDQKFIFLLKPDRHRFWTRSIALRDADDILADLRSQGF